MTLIPLISAIVAKPETVAVRATGGALTRESYNPGAGHRPVAAAFAIGLPVALVVALTSLGASAQPVGGAVQLAFVPNEGQFNEEVLYRADAQGVAIWLTKSGAVYQFVRVSPTAEVAGDAAEMAK